MEAKFTNQPFATSEADVLNLLCSEWCYLRLRGFFTEPERLIFLQQLAEAIGIGGRLNLPKGNIGQKLSTFQEATPYFKQANGLHRLLGGLPGHQVAVHRIANLFRSAGYKTELASDGDRNYFAGLISIGVENQDCLEMDYAPFSSAEFSVAEQISAQLSCILFLETGDAPIELEIFEQQWAIHDERFRLEHGSGFHKQVLNDWTDSKIVRPQSGDLVIFNSRQFHCLRSNQNTAIFSVSAGDVAKTALVLWS